jgi:hypothetical protein
MLVVLSAGMLAGLTATTIQPAPAFAETDDCIKYSNNSCNEVNDGEKSTTEDCSIVNVASGSTGDGGSGGNNGDNSNNFDCSSNNLVDPNIGGNAFSQVPQRDENRYYVSLPITLFLG